MNLIKQILKRILLGKSKPYNSVDAYKKSGNLVHGNNCKLEGLTISSVGIHSGVLNIEIGNDCYLACDIALQSPTSKIIIGDGVFIGPGTLLFCYDKITFESDIMVSWGCTFIDTNAHSLSSEIRKKDVRDWIKGPEFKDWSVVKHAPIVVRNKSWIGFNCTILKGVVVEEGTVVGAGSVVTKSTEPYCVYGGNPATFFRKTD